MEKSFFIPINIKINWLFLFGKRGSQWNIKVRLYIFLKHLNNTSEKSVFNLTISILAEKYFLWTMLQDSQL